MAQHCNVFKSRRHHVLDNKVAGTQLDETVKAIVKKGAIERKRVTWFAKAIAQLAMDYGKVLFEEKDFLKWLAEPHKELAKRSPLMCLWRDSRAGLKQVKRLLDRMESGGFS